MYWGQGTLFKFKVKLEANVLFLVYNHIEARSPKLASAS